MSQSTSTTAVCGEQSPATQNGGDQPSSASSPRVRSPSATPAANGESDSGRTPSLADVRSVDRELLLCLRSGESKSIGELTDMLGVTATAVRQRVERLSELRLIDREKVVAGRGRPTYRYLLTVAGYRRAGADAADLAEAMWHEILQISDRDVREQLVTAVARRLGQQYAAEMEVSSEPGQFAQRMRQLSTMLRAREIPAVAHQHGDLPVLDVEACPYPNLTDASDDRAMCRLEEQMLSEALGEDVHLNRCRLDGDSCCQFVASGAVASAVTANNGRPDLATAGTGSRPPCGQDG